MYDEDIWKDDNNETPEESKTEQETVTASGTSESTETASQTTESAAENRTAQTTDAASQDTKTADPWAAGRQDYGQQQSTQQTQNNWYGQQNQNSYYQNNQQYNQSQQGQQTYGQNQQYSQGQTGQQTYGQGQTGQQYSQNQQTYTQGQQYGQNGQYSQNNQQGYGQNRYPYGNPYQYNYYQGQNTAQSTSQSAPQSHKSTKKKSALRTTAMVTAAALLFGVVSGCTMFGVNRAAQIAFPSSTQAAAESTAPLETTPAIQSSQQSTQSATGVVIEDVSPIVDAVMPSVVSITNTMVYESRNWFGQTQSYEVPSSGSGIIVGENDTELLIVTNNHVIDDAKELSVTFIDESTVEAAVKGTDSEADLAVIAVPLEKISADTKAQIKAANLGDSDSLKMGQGVIAIGNALGLGQSVTVGHVSALDREITVDGVTKKVIQTDAAINPGNSGGALLNSNGEVIGINEAKYSNTDVEGIGYAIPISQAKDIIDDLMSRTTKIAVDEAEQGYLGIQCQNIDSSTAKLYGMPEGVYVYKITEDSAAAESDLREKDIITKLDGERVENYADLAELLTYYKTGTTVTLTVQSLENGEYVEREVSITLKTRPAEETKQ